MEKEFDSPHTAVADIPAGASVSISGFGAIHGFPSSLILALRDLGSRDLTVYCNGLGKPEQPTAQVLAENKQIRRLVASFASRPGVASASAKQIEEGQIDLELVPQGTLVERMRAGGGGIAAIYTPTAAGTAIARDKEVRHFDGRPHLLETGIRTDYALLRGHRADRAGNVTFRGGSRSFNDCFAKAARVSIIEVAEIVEIGEIPPQEIDLPGAFVSRVVKATVGMDVSTLPGRHWRPPASGRTYVDKPGLTRSQIARKVAALFGSGDLVTLGAGLPTLVTDFVQEKGVVLHAENGVLNYGGLVADGQRDADLHDAGGNFITLNPGASFLESATSFELARSGRLDAVVLGAYQVGANGDLANWANPGMVGGGIGGAMDLAVGARHVVAMLEHLDSAGRCKLVQQCDYPITAPECVDVIVTDLAVLRRREGVFRLEEVAEGFTVEEVLGMTEMRVDVADDISVMQETW